MRKIYVLADIEKIIKYLEKNNCDFFTLNVFTNKFTKLNIPIDVIPDSLHIYNNMSIHCSKISEEQKIINELLYIGFNIKHIGTQYLYEAIMFINKTYPNLEINLERDVYSFIARKYKKSVVNIKNNIIKATNFMYAETPFEILQNYFSYNVDTKPTPKIIIITILKKISHCN